MSDVLRVLTEARELITPVERWTQGDLARDGDGNSVETLDRNAVCWCALGAVAKVSGINESPGFYPSAVGEGVLMALERAAAELCPIGDGFRHVPALNDKADHAAVLAMFDAAIATEQAKTEAASS